MRARSFLLRILWSPAFFLAFLMVMDVLLPFSETDTAVIKLKYISRGKGGREVYNITSEGSSSYDEAVDKSFYDETHINDEIRIKRTFLFKKWRTVELIRDSAVCAVSTGIDMYDMLPFAYIFLLPVLLTCPEDSFASALFKKESPAVESFWGTEFPTPKSFWGTESAETKITLFSLKTLFIVIIEFVALVILIRLFLAFLGYAEPI